MALDNPTPVTADSPVMPNIGVFLCKCGKNIGGSVDVDSLAQAVEALPAVKLVQLNTYTCSEPGQAEIETAIAEHKLKKNCDCRLFAAASRAPPGRNCSGATD